MINHREHANCDAAPGYAGPDKVFPAVDFEIDVNRVVWDPEYRSEVLAELRRRPDKTDNLKAS